MRPSLFLLHGFPGTGKLTVAKALASRLEGEGWTTRVVDNHWIANPVFGLVPHDGIIPLPAAVWDCVGEVAGAVLRTVEELTPPSWQLIFTAVLDGMTDVGYEERLEELASSRGAVFVPVRLWCAPEENVRRIVSPERRTRMKSMDPEEPHRLASREPRLTDHPHALTLDITSLPPEEAAAVIHAHAVRCSSRQR